MHLCERFRSSSVIDRESDRTTWWIREAVKIRKTWWIETKGVFLFSHVAYVVCHIDHRQHTLARPHWLPSDDSLRHSYTGTHQVSTTAESSQLSDNVGCRFGVSADRQDRQRTSDKSMTWFISRQCGHLWRTTRHCKPTMTVVILTLFCRQVPCGPTMWGCASGMPT